MTTDSPWSQRQLMAADALPPDASAAHALEDVKPTTRPQLKPDNAERPPSLRDRIQSAVGGDERSLEDLIRQYQNRIARFVVARIGHHDDFEDVCQGVFVKMVLSLRELKNVDVFEPWLFRIARNACTDHLRRRRWRHLFVPFAREHESVAAHDEAGVESGVRAFETALKVLPRAQQELIGLLRDKDWSYDELAQITSSTVPAVKARLFRARSKLRELLSSKETAT